MKNEAFYFLNQEEQGFLSCFSIFDNIPISIQNIFEIFEINESEEEDVYYFDMLHKLTSDGWLEFNDKKFLILSDNSEIVIKESKPNSDSCFQIINFFNEKFYSPKKTELKKLKKYIPFVNKIFQNIEDNSTILAALSDSYSTYYNSIGEKSNSTRYLIKAINIQTKANEKHPELCYYYNRLAVRYIEKGELNKSINYGYKSVRLSDELPYKNFFTLINSYNIISTAFDKKKKHKISLSYSLKAIEIVEERFEDHKQELYGLYHDAAISFFKIKDYTNASKFISLAISNYKLGVPQLDEYLKELFTLRKIISILSKFSQLVKNYGIYFLVFIIVAITAIMFFWIW